MVVDFAFKRTPAYRVAYVTWSGPWSDKRIRSEFEKVAAWARKSGVKTGSWIFREPGDQRWEVAIELRGKVARGSPPVRVKTYPATRVASVVFDPEVVSPAVVWHGLHDWLRWRRKDRKVRSVGSHREVYSGNPWTDAKASAHTDMQYTVTP